MRGNNICDACLLSSGYRAGHFYVDFRISFNTSSQQPHSGGTIIPQKTVKNLRLRVAV